jgi:hypothetical protein
MEPFKYSPTATQDATDVHDTDVNRPWRALDGNGVVSTVQTPPVLRSVNGRWCPPAF